jgi:hypothetical protein
MLGDNLCHLTDHRGYCLYSAAWKLAACDDPAALLFVR